MGRFLGATSILSAVAVPDVELKIKTPFVVAEVTRTTSLGAINYPKTIEFLLDNRLCDHCLDPTRPPTKLLG